MGHSLAHYFSAIKERLGLPSSVDFRVIDSVTGFAIHRKKTVEPVLLWRYVESVEPSTRVGRLLSELERRLGAQIGVRIEMRIAGHQIDGRKTLGGLGANMRPTRRPPSALGRLRPTLRSSSAPGPLRPTRRPASERRLSIH